MLDQLTYAQIGNRLNISSKEARAIIKRNRLPRSHANDGRTLVAVDLDELQNKPASAQSPHGRPATGALDEFMARIERLEAELAAEHRRSVGHRADYERERERADQLMIGQDKLVIQVKNLRLLLQAARQEGQRGWWRWLRRTG
jgi:hypothetical protein